MRFTTKLLLLRHHCHRRHLLPLSSASSSSSSALSHNPISPTPILRPFPSSSSRSFSWFGWSRPSASGGASAIAAEFGGDDHNSDAINSSSSLESFESALEPSPPVYSAGGACPSDLEQDDGGIGGSLGMADEVVGDGSWFYPVNGVISVPSASGGASAIAAEVGGDDHSSDTRNSSSSLEAFESALESSPSVYSAGGACPSDLEQDGGGGGSLGMADEVVGDGSWFYPVHGVISVLDGCHDLTGLPWWAIISTSTIALRFTLLPVLILQLRKGQEIESFFPKLPPPFPPPLSGRSFREQYMLFQQKRKELGCPTYLWNFAFFLVQFPCFLLWMTSIRRMCLENHPGFDNGGMLWFQNLSDFPSGLVGSTFPILIAGLHYVNVQISFQKLKFSKLSGILGLLTKYYKLYLDILSVPLLLIGFHIPQGSLVYWVTNSTFTLFQQLSLRNSYVRLHLGFKDDKIPMRKTIPHNVLPDDKELEDEICVDTLSPQKLLDVALEKLASGCQDKALPLLRMAIERDPDLVKALIAMGQILCSQKSFIEAIDYFKNAVLKIQDKEDELLVLALYGLGFSHICQGDKPEGIKHLKMIADLKEPDNPMGKACYHQGLVLLGSSLFQEGQKSEAAKYLRIAATYDPAVNAYVKECEEG